MDEQRGNRKQIVPEELSTEDVMRVFRWSRTEVSRRRRSGDLPEPDPWRGSPRKPRWARETIMESLTRLGLLDGVVAAAFDGDMSSPVRWGFVGTDRVRLPQLSATGGVESSNWYQVVRYRRLDGGPAFADSPEFQLSLCIAVDDPDPDRSFHAQFVRSQVAYALGYGQGEAGTIAVIIPSGEKNVHRPQLRFARIPADFPDDHVIVLEPVEHDQVPVAAHLLGHPLPAWTMEEITSVGIAQWTPTRWSAGAEQIKLAVPRALTEAHAFRRTVEAVISRIDAGEVAAETEVVDALRALINRAWELPLMFLRRRHSLPPGWAWVFELPEPGEYDSATDHEPGLRWLATSVKAPAQAAEFATHYFGYAASTGVALLDLDRLTPATRAAVEKSLHPEQAGETWLHAALDRKLTAASITGPRSHWRWSGDPDPNSHPCIRVADVLAFHVPRVRSALTVPAYVEVVETSQGEAHWYSALAVDIDGNVAPLPLHPTDRSSLAGALTVAIWAPTVELLPGRSSVVGNVPPGVHQLLALLETGEPLQIDWDELAATTGPGPGPHATWDEVYRYRQGDPQVEQR